MPTKISDPKNIKIAFFDLDGTLINAAGFISEAAVSEIGRIREQGILTAIATGRPLFSAKPSMEQLGINALSAVFSGAMIYDPVTKRPYWKDLLPTGDLIEFVKEIRKLKIPFEIYTEDSYFIESIHELVELHTKYLKRGPEMKDLTEAAFSFEIVKGVAILTEENRKYFLEGFMPKFPQFTAACGKGAAHSEITFANITSKTATREAAFELIVSHYGLRPENVIAFGDELSDIPFLTMAGIGVAVKNAAHEVKNRADYIAASVEEDGVASVIRELF